MATTTNAPWWASDKDGARQRRIEKISKYRNASTYTDEILIWTRRGLWCSLLFTGILCGASYFTFFERIGHPVVAGLAALLVTLLIEIGKAKLALFAVRIPFLDGFRAIFADVASSFEFLGVVLFSVAIFGMSLYNSTIGASQFSRLVGYERHEVGFQPNTPDLDEKISKAQSRIADHQKNKWKGVVSYESQKAITAETRAVQKLEDQKAARITEQRADFERTRSFSDQANENTGSRVLAVGGFLEAIQILLLIVWGACERKLDQKIQKEYDAARTAPAATATSPTPAASRPVAPASPFVQFERQGTPGTSHNGQSYPQNSAPRKIGYDYGQNATPRTPQSVPQNTTSVPQITVVDPDAVLKLSRSNILKNWRNNDDRHANNTTVAGRLTGHVYEATQHFHKPEFVPLDVKGWGDWVTAFVEMFNRWNPILPEVFTDEYLRQVHGLIEQVNARRDQVARSQYSLFPEPEPTTAP